MTEKVDSHYQDILSGNDGGSEFFRKNRSLSSFKDSVDSSSSPDKKLLFPDRSLKNVLSEKYPNQKIIGKPCLFNEYFKATDPFLEIGMEERSKSSSEAGLKYPHNPMLSFLILEKTKN